MFVCFCFWRNSPPVGQGPLIQSSFLDHTRRTTFSRTPLDKWSARRRDLYLTTHNTENRQTSMTPVGYWPTMSPGELPQTYSLDRAALGGAKFLIVLPHFFQTNTVCPAFNYYNRFLAQTFCIHNSLSSKHSTICEEVQKLYNQHKR